MGGEGRGVWEARMKWQVVELYRVACLSHVNERPGRR